MRKLQGAAAALFVLAAVLASSAGAAVTVPSGDTCAATGTSTSYTLTINLPATAASQGGFAFAVTGASITNVNIAGDGGSLSTENLPAGTSAQWVMGTAARPGETVTVALTTSAHVAGPFTVVPEMSPVSSTNYTSFACALSAGSGAPSNVFTANQHVTYDSSARAWHLAVAVPGPGSITGVQAVATSAGSGSKQLAPKSLVQARKVVAKAAGKYTLSLRLTALGSASMAKTGSLKVKMTVAFNPKDGKSASKLLSLTLTK